MLVIQLVNKSRTIKNKKTSKTNEKRPIDLITGPTSGIGELLISELLKKGHEVRVIVRKDPVQSGDLLKLPRGVIPYISDITFNTTEDKENLYEACIDVDNVFHIAGATYNSKYTFDELININVVGTENLLNSIVKATADNNKKVRFIFVSSVTVYGYTRKNEKLTETSKPNPMSHYSESKVMAEQVINSICAVHLNISYTNLRFGIFYGYDYKKSFYKIFSNIYKGHGYYIGNGDNHLIFISEYDAVRAMLAVISTDKSLNQVYNVSDGVPYTIKEIFQFVADQLGVKLPNVGIPKAIAKLGRKIINMNYDEFEFIASDRILDISKIKKDLGFVPSSNIYKDGKNLIDLYKHEVLNIK